MYIFQCLNLGLVFHDSLVLTDFLKNRVLDPTSDIVQQAESDGEKLSIHASGN